MPRSKWGIPNHVNEDELVPDATRADHFVWPHPSGNPALDEVYHMPAEFAASRSEEDDDRALKKAARTRQFASKSEADAIVEKAEARAKAIIAEAEGQARAIKARGTLEPGPMDATHSEDDPDDPQYDTPQEAAARARRDRRPPPPKADANLISPDVVNASNPSGSETVPGRDNPKVRESVA